MNEGTKDRIAKNEALFREVNERVREIDSRQAGGPEHAWDFLCECGYPDCTQAVRLTIDEYEAVRASPVTFAVLPGHEVLEVEAVVHRHDRYLVVEKHLEEQDVALKTDPRAT